MRAVVQRVSRASVEVDEECVGRIGLGWLVLLGVARGDTEEDAARLADKILESPCLRRRARQDEPERS